VKLDKLILDFKLSPCFDCSFFSFGVSPRRQCIIVC